MAIFAAIWWVAGMYASHNGSPLRYCVGFIVSACIIVAALRPPEEKLPAEAVERRGRLVGIASAAEGALIFAAFVILPNVGGMRFAAPIVAMIVGIHFLPLARWMPERLYYVTAALLTALGIAGLSISALDDRIAVVCAGAASVLWVTCAIRMFSAGKTSATSGTSASCSGSEQSESIGR